MNTMNVIETLETSAMVAAALPGIAIKAHLWAAWLAARYGRPPPRFDFKPRGEVQAYINHGRWVADCPYCSGAMIVSWRDPLFWCVGCDMEENDGWPAAVAIPRNREDIEQALLMRKRVENRNWRPGERIDDLVRENQEHQVRGIYRVQ